MPDARPSGTRGLRRGRTVGVRFRDASAHQTLLCMRTSYSVTPEEDPTTLKNSKLESATREEPDIGPEPREPLKRDTRTWHQGQLQEENEYIGVFSQ